MKDILWYIVSWWQQRRYVKNGSYQFVHILLDIYSIIQYAGLVYPPNILVDINQVFNYEMDLVFIANLVHML